jgi:hypothetical protein
LTAVVLGLLVGCDAGSSPGDGSGDEKVNPRTEASQTDEYVAEALAKDKVPAKQWLSEVNHLPFGKTKAEVLKVTDDLLAAGAKGVYADLIEVHSQKILSSLLVELPDDKMKRARCIDIYNTTLKKAEPLKDYGQKYLDYEWK